MYIPNKVTEIQERIENWVTNGRKYYENWNPLNKVFGKYNTPQINSKCTRKGGMGKSQMLQNIKHGQGDIDRTYLLQHLEQ
ncbi:MAG: hypothetical protein WC755_05640 [Candidatus Woesearchaeota archaeon]|jgi:hypothetical protein